MTSSSQLDGDDALTMMSSKSQLQSRARNAAVGRLRQAARVCRHTHPQTSPTRRRYSLDLAYSIILTVIYSDTW